MNEKLLNDLLASAIRRGQVPLELNDTIVDALLERPGKEISEASKARFKSKLQIRMQDAAIASARKTIDNETLPFGHFIETIRERAGLNRSDVGKRLQKDDEYVERVERGHISPLGLSTAEFADIVELFRVKVKALPGMIIASRTAAGAKQGYSAVARSHGGITHGKRGEDVERALEAFARMRQPKEQLTADMPENVRASLQKLEAELKRRGRNELLE
jgi:hypothetical protein